MSPLRRRILLRDLQFALDIAVVVCLAAAALFMAGAVISLVALVYMAVTR